MPVRVNVNPNARVNRRTPERHGAAREEPQMEQDEKVAAQSDERRPLLNRPAETAGAGGAIATLAAVAFGETDPNTIAAIGVAAGLLPAAVTLVVSNGGFRGIARTLWRGR